ncbi:MAG: DNA mismatch repair endonuclease MutL, partial [Clostridiales bacterium]
MTSLTSLGFRGEALPAIAAVSQFCITSKQPGADRGYTMTVRDGKAGIPAEAAAKEGTVMVVDRLFYNTPARKKFLKSARSEFAAISELMVKLALSRPGISFTLRHGTKNIFATAGSGDLDVAIISTYGRETADNLIRLEHLGHNMMYGLISLPSLTRANRQEYNFFVNGRWVKSRELERVVDDAYDTLLPARRFPLVFLFFELDPSNVDVNVHPAKLEIKLREPDVL